jgi:hypothetical protein
MEAHDAGARRGFRHPSSRPALFGARTRLRDMRGGRAFYGVGGHRFRPLGKAAASDRRTGDGPEDPAKTVDVPLRAGRVLP